MFKSLYKIGFIAYAGLLVLAILFYFERTVFVDISYLLFNILKDDSLAIQVYRFGAAFTQIFPLICSKLKLPLTQIMMIYSASVIIYYFVCYLIIGRVLKRYDIALGLLLFNTLIVTDTFYWMQAELPHGVAMLFVLLAYVQSNLAAKNKFVAFIVTTALVATVSFFHPLLFILGLYIVAFYFARRHDINNRLVFIFAIIAFVVAQFVKAKWFTNQYDTIATGHKQNVKNFFPNYHELYATKTFVKNWFGKFFWLPVTSILIVVFSVIKRRWIELIIFIGAFAGYTILICASYPGSDVKPFYIENLYLPLEVIVALPFIYIVLPQLKQKIAIGLFLLIIVSGLIRMYNAHHTYTQRVAWERDFLSKHRHEKLLVSEKAVPMDTVIMSWGSCYEFWLLSTIEYGESASILINDNPTGKLLPPQASKTFITTWEPFSYKELPKQYFKFTDTTTLYRVIE